VLTVPDFKRSGVDTTRFVMVRPPDPQMLDFLSGYDRPVADIALALREMVLEEAPDAVEKVYQNHPSAVWFGFGPKMKDMFCYIATATRHVNLGFVAAPRFPIRTACLKARARRCVT